MSVVTCHHRSRAGALWGARGPPGWEPPPISYRLVEVMPHRISEGPDGVIEDQQVLVLVLAEGKD